MSNEFRGTGNLGASPSLKYAQVKGESKPVLELRIFFDNYRPTGNGDFEQTGGFWLNTSLWGDRAEHASRILRKGARVHVYGRLVEQEWESKETGELRKGMHLNADELFVSLSRIDEIVFKPAREPGGATDTGPSEDVGDEAVY